MFACRDAMDLLTEERDGALTGWSRVKYRTHMLICAHCRACKRQLEEAIAIAKEIPKDDPPPNIEASALDAFRKRRS
jgi:hypothetical protein